MARESKQARGEKRFGKPSRLVDMAISGRWRLPFWYTPEQIVRYNTIDIEPMKRVLRTEGNIESEGLKRALHICRGHFSHYSEEKPLFGKVAGTFWIPSHVRGQVKEGVVVSDYRVSTK